MSFDDKERVRCAIFDALVELEGRQKQYDGFVVADGIVAAIETAGYRIVPTEHLKLAYLIVSKDATDAPGRISTAIRPFLEGVLERAGINRDTEGANPPPRPDLIGPK